MIKVFSLFIQRYKFQRIFKRSTSNKSEEALSVTDKEIIKHHQIAVEKEEKFYLDPQTGFHVMTSYFHLKRGKCCGSACRHCPYNQINVKDNSNKKSFNGYFYK